MVAAAVLAELVQRVAVAVALAAALAVLAVPERLEAHTQVARAGQLVVLAQMAPRVLVQSRLAAALAAQVEYKTRAAVVAVEFCPALVPLRLLVVLVNLAVLAEAQMHQVQVPHPARLLRPMEAGAAADGALLVVVVVLATRAAPLARPLL